MKTMMLATLMSLILPLGSKASQMDGLEFTLQTKCLLFGGCSFERSIYEEALDGKANDRCSQQSSGLATRVSKYREIDDRTLESTYKCDLTFRETVTFEAFGWNALYAFSYPEEFKKSGEENLIQKAGERCSPHNAVLEGKIIFSAQMVSQAHYQDVTFGHFYCEGW